MWGMGCHMCDMSSFVVEFRVAGFTDTDWFLRGREGGGVRRTSLAEYVAGKGKEYIVINISCTGREQVLGLHTYPQLRQ